MARAAAIKVSHSFFKYKALKAKQQQVQYSFMFCSFTKRRVSSAAAALLDNGLVIKETIIKSLYRLPKATF